MRVLFLTPHPIEGPSSRFRIYQYLPYLEAHGITAVVRPFLSSSRARHIYQPSSVGRKVAVTAAATLARMADIPRAHRFDIAYVLREAFPFGPPWFERGLRALAGRLVFDFDDAIWQPSIIFENPLDRLRDWNKPAKIIRLADHVVVGSQVLADYACQFAPDPSRVSVIPTVVDPRRYRPAPPTVRRDVTIGWIGTPRNTGYLRDLLPVFKELNRGDPLIRFVLVGAEPFDCGALPVTFKSWELAEEIADIQHFDIGVMPLRDDEHTRGKCGFKLIQYMSCGVPVVCSPIGANRDIVDHGRSGFFADTLTDWVGRLAELARDPQLRRRMGQNGRSRVFQNYSLQVMAPQLLSVLHVAKERKAPSRREAA